MKPGSHRRFIHLCGKGGVEKMFNLAHLSLYYQVASPPISGRSYSDNSGLRYLSGDRAFTSGTWRVCGGAVT